MTRSACLLVAALLPLLASCTVHIGTGIYDATGPITELVMMGMANPKQIGDGLHIRLRSRTFIALDDATGKRFAFTSLDAGMGGIVLSNHVLKKLQERIPGNLYSDQNVAISGTHSHSGPSGFLQM